MIDGSIIQAYSACCRESKQTDLKPLKIQKQSDKKNYTAVDALGNLTRGLLTGDQETDITSAHALIKGMDPEMVTAHKGYNANLRVAAIETKEAQPIILPKSNHIKPWKYHNDLYKNRNLIARFFNRIKPFHRIAMRYEKSDK